MIDTQAHLQGGPGPQAGGTERTTGLSRRTAVALVVAFLLVVLASLMSLVHLPYAILKPGPITNTLGAAKSGKQLIEVEGKTYPTSGALDFTTVEVYGGPNYPVNGWRALSSLFDSSSQVLPEEVMFPKGTTGKQVEEENAAEMADSQQEAVAVALRKAGYPVPEVVTISSVQPGAASGTTLQAGDVIVAVDGVKTAGVTSVRDRVQAHRPGDTLQLTVRRAGKEQTLAVRTGSQGGRTVLGVLLRLSFDAPLRVRINAGVVGGPSAGLMFSLGVYDKITPGQLTGGVNVAGTGTIDSTGTVGPIGGIRQKMVGARDGGATWFLAPAANCAEVVGHVPDGLNVVRVASFDQAKAAVQAIAAKQTRELPTCTVDTSAAG
ncbi:MAG TPA: PDZ domain-containing protein [Dermatophilaceae bacterium]|nr:PDZ domain-containing protein [Dermatophilaceae bacterium]